MQDSINKAIELLAPAGSLESFFAAVENGADAVFCGLSSFSARAKAKNFSLSEFKQLQGYAAARGVQVYVALNTLVQEKELPEIVEVLLDLEEGEVDGIIIQDMGLYHLARTWFPGIPLHASTQMQCHNLAAVLKLEELGFARVVLARELSLKEIRYIRSKSSIEIEHFVHGAMCYSISGHCLFSSYLDGRSGNRGRCIQPCRRRYHTNEQSGFHFSTCDFSAIEYVPQLIDAGVTSFKIEGRMKSAEYVAAVVGAYRMVLDAPSSQRKEYITEALKRLNVTMGRSTTHGFLKGTGNKRLVLSSQKGGLGKYIGRVQRVKNQLVFFTPTDTLYVGDRIRIQPENDRQGTGFTLRSMKVHNKPSKRAAKGAFVTIPLPRSMGVSKGDLIYKLSTGKLFTASRETCLRRLSTAPSRTVPVYITFDCKQQGVTLRGRTEAGEGDVLLEKSYNVEMFPADRTPLTMNALNKVFTKTATSAIRLAKLYASKLPPVIIKPSDLNRIRRDFYKRLVTALTEKEQREREHKTERITSALAARSRKEGKMKQEEQLFLVTDQVEDMGIMADYPHMVFVVPLKEPLVTAVRNTNIDLQQIVWDLPSVLYDAHWQSSVNVVKDLLRAGFYRFRINNLSHLYIFREQQHVELYGGPWLYTLNSQTIQWQKTEGLLGYTISVEDDKRNTETLLRENNMQMVMLVVYATVALFTSRIQLDSDEKNIAIQNDQGNLFNQHQDDHLVMTTARQPFSLLGMLQRTRQMGCVNFVLDLQGVGFMSAKGQEVVQAFYEDRPLPNTTPFNFERGLL